MRKYARVTSQARMLAFSFGDHRDTERLDVRFTSRASVSVNDHRGVNVYRREERSDGENHLPYPAV